MCNTWRPLVVVKSSIAKKCVHRVVHILQWGYKIILWEPVKLSTVPIIQSGYMNQEKQKFLQDCVTQMLIKKVIVPVRLVTGYRSKCAKQTSFSSDFQNGNCRGHSKCYLQRGMGSIHRFDRCLLPYPYTRKVSTSSKISCGRKHVPVPGPSIRHCYGSPRVHLSCEGTKAFASKQGNSYSPVSR